MWEFQNGFCSINEWKLESVQICFITWWYSVFLLFFWKYHFSESLERLNVSPHSRKYPGQIFFYSYIFIMVQANKARLFHICEHCIVYINISYSCKAIKIKKYQTICKCFLMFCFLQVLVCFNLSAWQLLVYYIKPFMCLRD